MPRKVRELIADLIRAGFVNRGGKGSYRNFEHATGIIATISGKEGEDAQHYQEKLVKLRIKEAKEKETRP
jgi:predicted RNA binding protein YcfA (HicA-like mRNA interferase family)